jgi:hypothetical protein
VVEVVTAQENSRLIHEHKVVLEVVAKVEGILTQKYQQTMVLQTQAVAVVALMEQQDQ